MSIPKEPRQLMINLMYLVLTAMLALNVSAEIINAFFDLDKSLKKSAEVATAGAKQTQDGVQSMLDKKPALKVALNTGMTETASKVEDFVKFVEGIRSKLIDETGNKNGQEDEGDYDDHHHPLGKKNKDATTRLLAETGANGLGKELETKIQTLKGDLLGIFRKAISNPDVVKEKRFTPASIDAQVKALDAALALGIDSSWTTSGKLNWADYKFRQMPLAAALPNLSKIEADARTAQADIFNKLAGMVGTFEIKIDKFFPVISAKQGYVIRCEKFEADVAVGSYSSQFASTTSLTVNGTSVRLDGNGIGKYSETPSSAGTKTVNLACTVRNPLTGDSFSGTSKFEYMVGLKSEVAATVSADKMNVFYIGVDNPVTVSITGGNSNDLRVSASGVNLTGSGSKYTVTANTPGKATINVVAKEFNENFEFRVKRIPDPVAKLGKDNSGAMGNGEFKVQAMNGVLAVLENFDFDARCEIQGYEMTRVAKRQDPTSAVNAGRTPNGQCATMVNMANPGDIYYFDNVKARCPGDAAGRKINSMVWKIK